jgi:predicted ATPase/class 3 adenylate cyclase
MTSNLPSGTVTFLFTDIEGSSQLWDMFPEAMKTALEKHDVLLRKTVESCGGHVVKSTGDGIHAAFESVRDGLRATIEAQQALREEPWDDIKPHRVRVRMGLHTGEAQLRAGDYFGRVLNRTARLMSAGHGGQVLVSGAARHLLLESLPAGVTLRDLGEHRLRGLTEPEHVYQLVHPGLDSEFPALQTQDSFPNNLPTQLTSFVGRERELASAKEKLSSARLLSLIGPGGTGKTRLSLQLATDVLGSYPDGVWFVELAALTEAALIPHAIASAVGVRQQMGMPLMDLLIDYLRTRTLLLILDNCEHLVEACAKLADQLLHACPDIQIVASSREALDIRGEMILRVPSLSLPDETKVTAQALSENEAVQLFCERALAAAPKFALSDKNAPSVAEICRRLDGIPLALELAAARVTVLSPDQIASRLDDRFRLLTGGGRTAVPRQQTLRAMIDWSYEILSEPERKSLRALSVFASSWTFEAAEAVCPGLDVLDLLTQLVNKSLVIMESEENGTRYRLLETIRQYGREKALEAGEWEGLGHVQLAYFVDLAELGSHKLFSPEVYEWIPRLLVEYDNFRSALEWGMEHEPEVALRLAGALSGLWLRSGRSAEGVNWTSEALRREEQRPTLEGEAGRQQKRLRLNAWHVIAILAYLNDNRVALEAAQRCVDLARLLGDARMLVINLAIVCWEKMIFGENAGALAAVEEGLNLARSGGDKYAEGIALGALAWYRLTVDHDVEAARLNEAQSLALLEGEVFSWGGLQSFFGPARGALLRGDYAAARERFAKALPIFEKMGDEHRVTMIQSWLAHMQRHEGHFREAESEYRKTIRLWQKLGHRGAVAHQLESFAMVALELGQPERAARLFGAAEALREKIAMPMDPDERIEYDQQVGALRGRLEEDTLASAWAAGRALTMEQAISYAVSESAP